MNAKIALEEHFLLEGFQQYAFSFVNTARYADLDRRLLDTGRARLDEMDRAGIGLAILSLSAPGIQAEPDPRRAVDAARRANDLLAEQIVARRPDRFRGFAALPLQDPEAAADELERSVRKLGFVGAMVNGYSNLGDAGTGVYLDEDRYRPFWERVAALDVPFYLHPRDPLPGQQRIYEREASEWFDICSISETDRVKIGRTNAARLFHLDAGVKAEGAASPRAA